ncbi:MAG TPA: hypothetical protein DD381_11505 [Lentisphaeria bacterium]|nr:MAG: hypothetical protein A2X47_10045 [Lentisphaerae bacterium GWF2_38_69]HBM16956.1 hypothetical protein [Lentisphaeria bacterium]
MEPILLLGTASVSPFYAFSHSDTVGKIIVIALFIVSIYSWTVMIDKFINLSKMLKQSRAFKAIFRDAKYPLMIFIEGRKEKSMLGELYMKASIELLDFYKLDELHANQYGSRAFPSKKLSFGQLETVRTVLDQTVSDNIIELEDKMGFLATAISIGPLMGLFGTVWGIMMAFISMAVIGKADIPAMAPGVSSALLTTVLGLTVAIPSLIGYNVLASYIKKLIAHMDNFSDEYITKLKLEQND